MKIVTYVSDIFIFDKKKSTHCDMLNHAASLFDFQIKYISSSQEVLNRYLYNFVKYSDIQKKNRRTNDNLKMSHCYIDY